MLCNTCVPFVDITNDGENSPNYELLALTKGFPFFMPGNVGPAWHDLYSTVHKNNLVIHEITKVINNSALPILFYTYVYNTFCELFIDQRRKC